MDNEKLKKMISEIKPNMTLYNEYQIGFNDGYNIGFEDAINKASKIFDISTRIKTKEDEKKVILENISGQDYDEILTTENIGL